MRPILRQITTDDLGVSAAFGPDGIWISSERTWVPTRRSDTLQGVGWTRFTVRQRRSPKYDAADMALKEHHQT